MYCNTLAEPLIKKIEIEKKTLDEIAGEVCGDTVKNPRNKIIRIIKVLLGGEYLQEHAQTLGYNTVKAVRQKSTDEVVKRKIVTEKVVEDSDISDQTNGQDGVLEEHDKLAACCHQAARKVIRKIDTENNEEERSGKTEQRLEELDDVPEIDASNDIVGEIMAIIEKYSLEDVKKAIAEVESYM
jgi:hypothetical protein